MWLDLLFKDIIYLLLSIFWLYFGGIWKKSIVSSLFIREEFIVYSFKGRAPGNGKGYGHKLINYQCLTNGHDLVSYQCQHEHKLINYQCLTNGHDLVSYQCQHGHKLINYQCQTNGRDLVSYQCQHGHKLVNYQCQTNAHDIINSFVQTRINYSLTVIKAEYIPTNCIWGFYVTS